MSTPRKQFPRIYCLPATEAPIVAVIQRGPSRWAHVGRWDLGRGQYEAGAWLEGRIYARRCDLSPDGRFLSYFAFQPYAAWEHGGTYVAVSRLPWLAALHAFGTCGTWTRGYHFVREECLEPADRRIEGTSYGLRATPSVQFANERLRGWIEAADSPPRAPNDPWDQHRNARMQKGQPGGSAVLRVESLGWAGGEFGVDQAVDGLRVRYSMEKDGELSVLDDLQWADWSSDGKLLTATRSGKLQIFDDAERTSPPSFEADLSDVEPAPEPAPDWARSW